MVYLSRLCFIDALEGQNKLPCEISKPGMFFIPSTVKDLCTLTGMSDSFLEYAALVLPKQKSKVLEFVRWYAYPQKAKFQISQ